MIVGPSMSEKVTLSKRYWKKIISITRSPANIKKIHWFYGQYQDMFKNLKRSLGHDIYIREGLPTFHLNLSDIDPKYNNIIV